MTVKMTPSVRIDVSGARGESQADILRRTGQFGVLPTDGDDQVMAKLQASNTEAAVEAVEPFVQDAASSAATAIQARDAIFDMVAGVFVFATYAEAAAAVAPIAENRFVQVLKDETRAGHETIYRKAGGALVFILDRDAGAEVTLEQFGAVADCDPVAETGTPSDDALDAALAALVLAKGGRLRAIGRYLFLKAHLVPFNAATGPMADGQPGMPTQPAIVIQGNGIGSNGRQFPNAPWTSGSLFFWAAESGSAVAKITTIGLGSLTILDHEFGSVGLLKPMIHTTFTSLYTDRCSFRLGQVLSNGQQVWNEDAISLGGTLDHEANHSIDRTSQDCGFQGYGTVITNTYFNGVRRAVSGQRFANAVFIVHNTVWGSSGNHDGGAFEFDGQAGSATAGNVIGPNLIEMPNYKYGVAIYRSGYCFLNSNQCYDATETADSATAATVYVDPSCSPTNIVIGSVGPANKTVGGTFIPRPYLLDPGSRVASYVSAGSGPSWFAHLKAGDDTQENDFGRSVFRSAGGYPSRVQPANAALETAAIWEKLRAGNDPNRPGAVIDRTFYNGARVIGGNGAGNVYNENATGGLVGASWWNGGRSWGFDRTDPIEARRSGSTMDIDSGTGGSFINYYAFQHRFYSHAGQMVAAFRANGEVEIKSALFIDGKQLLGGRLPAISNSNTTEEKVDQILARLRAHGLIES